MESYILKSQKGQVAIEFMLLIVVMLLFVQAVIIPSVDISTAAVEDTTRFGQARFAAERIANAIDYLAASPGDGKQTLHVFAPEGVVIGCSGNFVTFTADMSAVPADCDAALDPTCHCNATSDPKTCTGNIAVSSCPILSLVSGALNTIVLNKTISGISVQVVG